MDIHENARTTPRSRMLIVERLEAGSTVAAVASAFGVDGRTVRKWRDRFRVEGAAGLVVRSSRPIPARSGSMPPPKPRSQSCGASGCRGRRSRAASAGRSLPSAGRCAGSGSAGSRLSTRPWQSSATSGKSPATDPHRFQEARQDRRHRPPHHRRPARPSIVAAVARVSAGRLSMSPSTTLPGSPTPKSCPTRRRRARPPSSSGARLLRAPWHQGRARHDRQRLGLQELALSKGTRRSASPTGEPFHTPHATTARAERYVPTSPRDTLLRPTIARARPSDTKPCRHGFAISRRPQTSYRQLSGRA